MVPRLELGVRGSVTLAALNLVTTAMILLLINGLDEDGSDGILPFFPYIL
jgi:hypothetical protein